MLSRQTDEESKSANSSKLETLYKCTNTTLLSYNYIHTEKYKFENFIRFKNFEKFILFLENGR